METLQKSRQGRKARLNVESMISFDGVSQYASVGVNQNILPVIDLEGDHSFSFIFSLKEHRSRFCFWGIYPALFDGVTAHAVRIGTTGNNYDIFHVYHEPGKALRFKSTVKFNTDTLYHVVWRHSTKTFVINNIETPSTQITQGWNVVNDTYDNPTNGALTVANLEGDSNFIAPINLSHLTFFNRTLTTEEIQYIHAQGGILPASTHEACVAHYPCTHREGNMLYDVVEQYNYAKATSLTPYHAALQNFTPEQHTGDNQTAWKDFYTKQDLRPYVDTNSDGMPDSPLIEKTSGLPPLRKALPMTTSPVTQSITCSDVGTIQGVRLAVKLDAVNQALLNLNATNANTAISVSSGSLSVGSSITGLQIYVDGIAQTAADAGAILNDLKLHDLVLLFDSIAAPDFRVPTAEKHIAALFIMAEKISRKEIIKLSNNNLFSQPSPAVQAKLARLYNFNEGIDTTGPINLENMLNNFGNAALSGYTAANFDSADPAYVLTDINDLR